MKKIYHGFSVIPAEAGISYLLYKNWDSRLPAACLPVGRVGMAFAGMT